MFNFATGRRALMSYERVADGARLPATVVIDIGPHAGLGNRRRAVGGGWRDRVREAR
jgi:hypothetical protein